MNDVLKDIEKLKEIQAICEYFSKDTIISYLEDMIKEKESIIHNFEKTYKEEECRRWAD